MPGLRLPTMLFMMFAAPVALAQTVYKWVDDDGNVHYSQTLPPERVQYEHDRLTEEGLLAERIARAPTAEERALLAERILGERNEVERERLQQQQNRLFLAAFPTEEDIERTIQSRLDTVRNERNTVQSLIDQSRASFNDMVQQAAAHERQGKPVPEWLNEQITDARGKLSALGRRLVEIDQRLADIEAERTEEIERHRQLTGKSPADSPADPPGNSN